MIVFDAPLWLIGLLTIPLIWWLHHLRHTNSPYPVSSLTLWSSSTQTDTRAMSSSWRRDKRWLLRALIATAVVLALANPSWNEHTSTAPLNAPEQTDNHGVITRLAVRSSIKNGINNNEMEGLVTVVNPGHEQLHTTLDIEEIKQTISIDLSPGEKKVYPFTYSSPDIDTLRATISNGDTLSLEHIARLPVTVIGACGRHLIAALTTHPGINLTTPNRARLIVNCSAQLEAGTTPQLWLHHSNTSSHNIEITDGIPAWHRQQKQLGDITLKPDWFRPTDTARLENAMPLLSIHDTPMATFSQQSGHTVIELLFDMEYPALVQRPEYIQLVSSLLELAIGHPLLEMHTIERALDHPVIGQHPDNNPDRQGATGSAPFFIIAAILLLLLDIRRSTLDMKGEM